MDCLTRLKAYHIYVGLLTGLYPQRVCLNFLWWRRCVFSSADFSHEDVTVVHMCSGSVRVHIQQPLSVNESTLYCIVKKRICRENSAEHGSKFHN